MDKKMMKYQNIKYIYLFIVLLCVCVHALECACMPWSESKLEKIGFFPTTMCVLGIELRFPDLGQAPLPTEPSY